MSRILPIALCLTMVAVLGCDISQTSQLAGRRADLRRIYGRSAQTPSPDRKPVIFIHGVLGARLRDSASGRIVWGEFTGNFARPNLPDGARLVALPMQQGVPLNQLQTTVAPDGLLRHVEVGIFGIPLPVGAYNDVAAALRLDEFDPDDGVDSYPSFSFAYDWRLSNVQNAARLHAFITEKRAVMQAYIERRYGVKDFDVKFDLIAHSMGGLVSRYFLRYGDAPLPADGSAPKLTWAGAAHVENVIIVGTPNSGFVDALNVVTNGLDIVSGVLPDYPGAVMGTHASWYEMLPRTRNRAVVNADNPAEVLDIYDVEVWKRMGWGLANPAQAHVLANLLPNETPEARRAIALDHLAKCLANAKAFQAALDAPGENRPKHLQVHLFSGDAVETNAVIAVNPRNGRQTVHETAPGDGVVTRASCLLDERVGQTWQARLVTPIDWETVIFLRTNHMGITADPTFLNNLAYIVLESPRSGASSGR